MKKMSAPALSVIVPFRSDSVVVTLASLSQCTEKEKFEVILVSDGLDRAALSFLEEHYASLEMKVVTTEKCGRIGHLRNLGIQQANSDCFYFIDSDCWLKEDAIARVLAAKGSSKVLKGRNVFIGRNWISRLDAQLRDERYESNPEFAYCPNLMVHANVFEHLGFFNAQYTYGSDGEFAKRISERGIEVKYDREIVLYHDVTENFTGVFRKWMNYGEARYYRYQNEAVKNKLSTYFPNLFNLKRGALYNGTALMCDIGRALGMLRAWRSKGPVNS
jgi:glycosyltransferase involved in cell wall biosynthesis